MVKSQLVIHSVSVWRHPNIRTWQPANPEQITEIVTISIGHRSTKGSDLFTIRVATPAGLSTLNAEDGILAIRPLLIMDKYDFQNLWNWLEKTVTKCDKGDWNACVHQLRLYFDWEYEGYKEGGLRNRTEAAKKP